MTYYNNKNIVILGMGITGLSCVNFFLSLGIEPCIMDISVSPFGLNKIPKNIKYYIGGYHNELLLAADLIVISPGIKLHHPIINQAINSGIEVISDIEIFCREAKSPIIAITGSNGKSTVTTLLSDMANSAGFKVGVGGNIGLPALNILEKEVDFYILELSSFQLATTFSLKTLASCILNITEEHMDYYPLGINQYRDTKLRIYNNSNFCVFNANDSMTAPPKKKIKRCVSFGINKGDYQLINKSWLQVQGKKILNTDKMILLGSHNFINGLAALALADIMGLPRDSSINVLMNFTGLPHRLQIVHNKNNVFWINDSKSTNINSTKAALDSLSINGTLWLLLGGNAKSADFSKLIPYLNNNHTQIYCFGQDGYIISKLIPEISYFVNTMYEAMQKISYQVKSGDVVLLSPACSSFDQFDNFEHRGDLFTKFAKELG